MQKISISSWWKKALTAFFFLFSAVMLLLLSHWEIGMETWGYWFFARVFAETGKFVVLARSPLYTLYLNLFLWMGYPNSVTAEFIVTSLICGLAIIFLLRLYTIQRFAVFAAILWLPFFVFSEPPVLALGLALCCFAVIARKLNSLALGLPLSYTLFVLASMVRVTYFMFIPLFLLWDIFKFKKNSHLKVSLLPGLRLVYFLPLLAAGGLLICVLTLPSPHRWNDVWFTTTEWFPYKGKTSGEAAFAQEANWKYIDRKHGSFRDEDFYFTNKELFKGADTVEKAFRANPGYVRWFIQRNTKDLFLKTEDFFGFNRLYQKASLDGRSFKLLRWLVIIVVIFLILYGVLRLPSKDPDMVIFISAILLIHASSVSGIPQVRYMIPLALIIMLSSYWYGKIISEIALKRLPTGLAAGLVLCIFSAPRIADWGKFVYNLTDDVKRKEVRILEARPPYLRAHFNYLSGLLKNSSGLMAFEHNFIGAFMDVDQRNIHDIWELPPFGGFSRDKFDSILNKERVGCLFISYDLSHHTGYATNVHLRYQNYIEPYSRYLKTMGARVYQMGDFGELVRIEK